MQTKFSMRWHPRAVLVTANNKRIGAADALATPPELPIPTDAARGLPLFFLGIAADQAPLIGGGSLAGKPRQFCTQTGGTTGTPKRLLRRCSSWEYSINRNQKLFDITPKSRVAVLGDLTHSLALYAGVEALSLGAEFHALAGVRSGTQALDARSVSHLYATPTQLRMLRGDPNPLLKYCIVGGGALNQATADHIAEIFPNAKTFRFYGASETSFVTCAAPSARIKDVGVPYDGVELEIRDQNGAPVPTGHVGTVWVRSPMQALGQITDSGLKSIADENGWVGVGELGSLDAERRLTLAGRADRMIQVADQSIHLDQVEAVALSAGVRHAAAISLPDNLRGNRVFLAVSDQPDNLSRHLETYLTKTAQPRAIQVVADWPLLPSGKTDYAAVMTLFDTATA